MRIIYNNAEKSGREENSKTKGCLNYEKETGNFSCDSSDMDCMGAHNYSNGFELTVEESGNTKSFEMEDAKWDDEGEMQYEIFISKDKKHKFFIWND